MQNNSSKNKTASKCGNFTLHHLTLDHSLKRNHLMLILNIFKAAKRRIVILAGSHLTADYLSCILNLKLNRKSSAIHEFKSQVENQRAIEEFSSGTVEILVTNSTDVEIRNSVAVTDIINYDLLVPNPLYFEIYHTPNEILHVY